MGTLRSEDLTFDGSSNTADQFSGVISTTNVSAITVAWILRVNVVTGPFAMTLQVNGDPDSDTKSSWQDVATTALTVLDMTNSVDLTQTDAGIESSKVRGGIITASSNTTDLYFPFTPLRASYRLRFQITAATVATVEWVLSVP